MRSITSMTWLKSRPKTISRIRTLPVPKQYPSKSLGAEKHYLGMIIKKALRLPVNRSGFYMRHYNKFSLNACLMCIALLVLLSSNAYPQDNVLNDVNYKKYYVVITVNDTLVLLPDKFITENSLKIFIDSLEISSSNYTIDYRYGKIKFTSQYFEELFSLTARGNAAVIVTYKNLPYNIPDEYSRFEILSRLDTLKEDTVRVAEIKDDFIEDIFTGTDLEKSGSIFRGFTIGNNRDLTLNSGFRLQMTGKLSKDIDIVAALTDESTPIQPEGNTQKLQEIDKVFVELRTPNLTTTLGDIDVNFSNLDFFNFSRKVQGAKGFGTLDKSDLFVSAAITRGQFNTNTFNGSDGVQGPYKLVGANNEVNIVVIAGSEKVYLDGIIMIRGENNDYTIDYPNGQLTFTNRRLITNASRVTVDFEYSDKKYSRSLLVGQANTIIFDDRLKLSFSYLRERDDQNKPIDFTISDSDRTIISNAGDDRLKASKSGVTFVGRDSLGFPLGFYIEVDTIINANQFRFYRYAPGDTNALYQVAFSFAGAGKGDYISLSTNSYRFAGIGQGSFLPVIFFPLPISYQSGDLNLDLKLSKNVSFRVEGAVSDFDQNLLSSNDDKNNQGLALNSSVVFNNDNFKLGSANLGMMKFTLRQKFINKLYNSLDRLNPVEYNRVWDIQDSTNQTENSTEAALTFQPKQYLVINTTGGRIKRGDSFNSLRSSVNVNFLGDSLLVPAVQYYADFISSNDKSVDYKGKWFRQSGVIDYKLKPFGEKFGTYNFIFGLDGEDKEISTAASDTASAGSYKFYEFKPAFILSNFFHMDFGYRFNYRFDDIFNNGSITRQSNSLTHTYSFRVKDLNFLASAVNVVFYDKKYADEFLSQGLSNNRTVLVTSQNNLWFFDRGIQTNLFYKVSSERSAKSEVVFIKVAVGQGNYKYLGDLNGNGLQDENEFVLVNYDGDYIKLIIQTDQTFPTTDLQASTGINIAPSRIFKIKTEGFVKEITDNISFDTYLSVSEKSKDPEQKNIYLLKFSKFLNEQNTIAGTNTVQQDVNLFQNHQYFGIRLRFIQKKGFNQYFSGNERLLGVERSFRLRLSFTPDLTLITDYVSETNRNLAPSLSFRNWNIGSKSVISEFTYTPIRSIETGFRIELKRANDFYPSNPTGADVNRQILKFSYSIESKGKLRIEIERDEAILSASTLFLPYELTKGITVGKSFLWTVSFDYRLTSFIQATINYFGRAEGRSKVIHTGTAELRAYF